MNYNVTDIEFDFDDDEANTEDEAIALYNRGHYKDSQYFMDDMFYNYEFDSISEMEAA